MRETFKEWLKRTRTKRMGNDLTRDMKSAWKAGRNSLVGDLLTPKEVSWKRKALMSKAESDALSFSCEANALREMFNQVLDCDNALAEYRKIKKEVEGDLK